MDQTTTHYALVIERIVGVAVKIESVKSLTVVFRRSPPPGSEHYDFRPGHVAVGDRNS